MERPGSGGEAPPCERGARGMTVEDDTVATAGLNRPSRVGVISRDSSEGIPEMTKKTTRLHSVIRSRYM